MGDNQTYGYNRLNMISAVNDTTSTVGNATFAYDAADNPTVLGTAANPGHSPNPATDKQVFNAANEQ